MPDSPTPGPRPLADRPLDEPHPDRLPADSATTLAILAAHRAALDTGDNGYADPATGLFVFSAGFLADRGFCCDTGCRHCPYVV